MANVYTDFVSGTLTSTITNAATTLVSSAFTSLATVAGSDIAKVILDPFGTNGAPEIVYVTAHTAGSNTVSGVQRGREGTIARPHNSGTVVYHGATATDFNDLRGEISTIKVSPATVIGTGAPATLLAGGTSVTGGSTTLSRSDHRHAMPAGTPVASSPGDTLDAGSSVEVARADHKHAREAYGGTPAAVGTVAAPGSSPTVARGDHVHVLGTGALSNYAQVGSALEVPIICTQATRPPHVKGRLIVETDTNRVLRSTGTDWLRERPLTQAARTGFTLTKALTVPNASLGTITDWTETFDSDNFYPGNGPTITIGGVFGGFWTFAWNGSLGTEPTKFTVRLNISGDGGAWPAIGAGSDTAGNGVSLWLSGGTTMNISVIQESGASRPSNFFFQGTLVKHTGG